MKYNSNFKIESNHLTPQIYLELHHQVGFKTYEVEDIQAGLDHDLFDVVVYDDSFPIGIARVVGDNRIVFFIKDVIVHPSYQHQGLGDLLMKYVLEYIGSVACHDAYIGLMATPGKETFYEKYGFMRRPNEKFGSGMVMFYES